MCKKKNAAKTSEKLKPFWGFVIFFNTQSVPNLSWRQAEEAKRKKKDLRSWSMTNDLWIFMDLLTKEKRELLFGFCMHVFMDFFYFCVFYGFSDRIGIRRKKWTYGHGWWFQHVSSTVVDCPASFLGIGSTARSVENPTTGMINGARRHLNESYMSTTNPL